MVYGNSLGLLIVADYILDTIVWAQFQVSTVVRVQKFLNVQQLTE